MTRGLVVIMVCLCVSPFLMISLVDLRAPLAAYAEGVFSFELPNEVAARFLTFQIDANGGTASGSLDGYCRKQHCSLPLVFGGAQVLTVLHSARAVTRYNIQSGENRFYCINGEWERRICRFRDICFDGTDLTFVSPYAIQTTVPFLVLGGRPPPYDKKRDRINSLRVNVSKSYTIPSDRVVHDETTIYASPYYNSGMLWHLFFDFTLPLFYTTTMFEPIGGKPMSVILPKSSESFNKDVIRSFAPSVQRHGLNHCYRDLIVGIDKVKDAATGTTYEFRKNITYKLMPKLLAHLQIDPRLPARPEILFVARKTKHRAFANFDEAVTALTNAFPDYTVKPAHLEDLPMRDQIEAAYKSTLFIGMHGSGLSHLAWMRSTAALVEIMPYKFTCRDWYERATAVSGVQYFKYRHPGAPHSRVTRHSDAPPVTGTS